MKTKTIRVKITKADAQKCGDYCDGRNCLIATALKRLSLLKRGTRVVPTGVVFDKPGLPYVYRFGTWPFWYWGDEMAYNFLCLGKPFREFTIRLIKEKEAK